MFVSVAHAMGSAGGAPAGGGDAFMQFVPLLLMLAIFYFLLIRPQQKRAKQHRAMLDALKKGDFVMTTGGLAGRIVEVEEDLLVLDLGETKVTVGRGYVSGLVDRKTTVKDLKGEKPGKAKNEKNEPADKPAEPAKEEAPAPAADADSEDKTSKPE